MRLLDLDLSATEHHGLVTQRTSGLSRSAWYRAIAAGALDQLHPGVARLAGTPRTYRQRIAAAVLAASTPIRTQNDRAASLPRRPLASHRSAASLWLGVVDPVTRGPASGESESTAPLVDLTFPDRQRSTSLTGVVVHRPRDVSRLTPQMVDGIRCTNILRTLLDLGAVDVPGVHDLLGHALSTRLVTLSAVEAVLLDHGKRGRTGTTALRRAVDGWAIDAKPADSVLEVAMVRLVERFGLPPIEFHPRIEGWEIDFRFVGTRLLVECDGWTTHGLQRDQFERDRRRDADLTAAGWIVSRHTYRAVTTSAAATARRLRSLLATASM